MNMELGTKVVAKREGKFVQGYIVGKAFYNNKDMISVKFPDEWEIWYPASDFNKEHGSIKELQNEPVR